MTLISKPSHHILKCKEPFFSAVASGTKNFEVREYRQQKCGECYGCRHVKDITGWCDNPKPARNFQVGDMLELQKPTTVRSIEGDPVDITVIERRRITYILKDTDFPEGIKPGFCVLGLEVL